MFPRQSITLTTLFIILHRNGKKKEHAYRHCQSFTARLTYNEQTENSNIFIESQKFSTNCLKYNKQDEDSNSQYFTHTHFGKRRHLYMSHAIATAATGRRCLVQSVESARSFILSSDIGLSALGQTIFGHLENTTRLFGFSAAVTL